VLSEGEGHSNGKVIADGWPATDLTCSAQYNFMLNFSTFPGLHLVPVDAGALDRLATRAPSRDPGYVVCRLRWKCPLYDGGVFHPVLSRRSIARVQPLRHGKAAFRATRGFSIIPKMMPEGYLRMGYVEVAETDIVRDSLIGAAPLILGNLA
jgi:hypothetical protein